MLQRPFVARIFRRCKELGLHTAWTRPASWAPVHRRRLLDDIDLVLLDIKSGDPETYQKVTASRCSRRSTSRAGCRPAARPMWVRFVLVPGLTDGRQRRGGRRLRRRASTTVERVEILPFHQMGRDKWDKLGLRYPLEDTQPPTAELVERVRAQFRDRGLTVF